MKSVELPLDKALFTYPFLPVSFFLLILHFKRGWSVSRRSLFLLTTLILLVKYYVIPNKVSVGYMLRLLRFGTNMGMLDSSSIAKIAAVEVPYLFSFLLRRIFMSASRLSSPLTLVTYYGVVTFKGEVPYCYHLIGLLHQQAI